MACLYVKKIEHLVRLYCETVTVPYIKVFTVTLLYCLHVQCKDCFFKCVLSQRVHTLGTGHFDVPGQKSDQNDYRSGHPCGSRGAMGGQRLACKREWSLSITGVKAVVLRVCLK